MIAPVVLPAVNLHVCYSTGVVPVLVAHLRHGAVVDAIVSADENDVVAGRCGVHVIDVDVVGILSELSPAIVEGAGREGKLIWPDKQAAWSGVGDCDGIVVGVSGKVVDVDVVRTELHVDAVPVLPGRVVGDVVDAAVAATGQADSPGDVLVDGEFKKELNEYRNLIGRGE